ncbi:electron transfer flavoprotein subunit beta/FixA family protein [Paenibacillus sp. CAU 1782]
MKWVVLLKQTFDTEEKIYFTEDGIREEDVKLVINPYDEYALEEALRWKEQLGGEVIAVTCGTERTHEALRLALAMGADQAIRVSSDGIPDDSGAIGEVLAAAIAPLQPDLLLAGLFAVDTGSGSVALQTAELLGLPHAGAVVKLSIGSAAELGIQPGDERLHALAVRDVEGDLETVSLPLPACITAQQGLNEPRYPSLPGIMKAKRKPLIVIEPSELKPYQPLSDAYVQRATPEGNSEAPTAADVFSVPSARTYRTKLSPPPPRAAGKRLTGSPEEQAQELARELHDVLEEALEKK